MRLWRLQENAQAVLHLETESNWDPAWDPSGVIMKGLRGAQNTPTAGPVLVEQPLLFVLLSDSLPSSSLRIMTELGKEVLGEVLLANFRVQPGSLKPAHLLQCVQHFL